MKKTISVLSVLALGACVYGNPVNNEGLYTEMDLNAVDWTAINKTGRACQTNIFGLIPVGDKSVPTAVKNGRIQHLSYIDTDYELYFPIMSRECTNVWGIGYSTPVVTSSAQIAPSATKTDAKATSNKKKK